MSESTILGGPERTVLIYDEGASFEQIAAVVREAHCQPVDGRDEANLTPEEAETCLAIVNAESEGALARWREGRGGYPTLLATGERSFDARLAASREGIQGLIELPLLSECLAGWLRHLFSRSHGRPARVLIVDDDPIAVEVGAAGLRSAGMEPVSRDNSRTAFAYLQENKVDAVLLDLQMPEVSGIELARIIRQQQENLSLPVIFLSGERDPQMQLEARRLGGDDFIIKPVSPRRLGQIVSLRLERAHALTGLIERDSLTGLLNHGTFNSKLEYEVERSRRNGADFSIALIDVDHFKSINDTYGHQVGDRVLRSLSTLLAGALRKTDLVGRWGGEEFAILFADASEEVAVDVADRLRESFAAINFDVGDARFNVSFSAGVCGYRRGAGAAEIVGAADSALYAAKAAGRRQTKRATLQIPQADKPLRRAS